MMQRIGWLVIALVLAPGCRAAHVRPTAPGGAGCGPADRAALASLDRAARDPARMAALARVVADTAVMRERLRSVDGAAAAARLGARPGVDSATVARLLAAVEARAARLQRCAG